MLHVTKCSIYVCTDLALADLGVGAGSAHRTGGLRLSNIIGILPKKVKTMWFIGVEVKHEARLKHLCYTP